MLLLSGSNKTNPIQTQFQTGHQPPPTPYLPPVFFKIYPKKCSCSSAKSLRSARNFQETFNMHLFLFDNSIVLHTKYTERHVYQSNMEKVYNAN